MAKVSGPGYASPLEAMKGPREKLLYVVCPNPVQEKPDALATVDVDPDSPTYCQIIHTLFLSYANDEVHHSGWNTCSSCYEPKGCCDTPKRDKLVLPALGSNRVYVIDTGDNPKAPSIYKVIEPEEINNLDCSALHTTHCLPTGEIMISSMGDKNGNAKCDFVLIDGKTYKPTGTWVKGKAPKFGYDFWYQPYYDIMVSTEWGTPNVFRKGFKPEDAVSKDYGRSLNFFSWSKRELIESIDLGSDGIAPLEVRFLHNPLQKQGFVGCAVNATVFRFYLGEDGKIKTERVIKIPPKKVTGWGDDYIQGMVTDVILSLDDKYLYLSNWLHGDVRQYDITDPQNPKLTGQIFLGGMIVNDSKVKVVEDQELSAPPEPVYVKNRRLYGAPQMLQLSLDGKRLYVTSSLFSPWDKQFYPNTFEHGATMVKLDVDVENGGLSLDEEFLVDFGKAPGGPLLAHEMRYPGGDCTSDIWLAN